MQHRETPERKTGQKKDLDESAAVPGSVPRVLSVERDKQSASAGEDLLTKRGFFTGKHPVGGNSPPLAPLFKLRNPLGLGRCQRQQRLRSRAQPPFIAPGEDSQAPHLFVRIWGVSKPQGMRHPCCNWIWARFLHIPWQFCCLVSKPGLFSLSSSGHLTRPDSSDRAWLSGVSPSRCRPLSLHAAWSWFASSRCDRSLTSPATGP